ncbi:unnamed protein product [Vitrella brassicaformis CCMP3155]|uniref:DNA (cytosine-5-)-methyltransferase n=2 Tax=Vitrella brassicaformis TaxID=1169539 RepID=A0A0G4F0M0_VITBC|nr:unnamed protein product [Vitrella brassicaformis CCMP3155]|eukprot:CEM05273.1 unnamed protein product [Vitrella brassicaformis CCMP3155]
MALQQQQGRTAEDAIDLTSPSPEPSPSPPRVARAEGRNAPPAAEKPTAKSHRQRRVDEPCDEPRADAGRSRSPDRRIRRPSQRPGSHEQPAASTGTSRSRAPSRNRQEADSATGLGFVDGRDREVRSRQGRRGEGRHIAGRPDDSADVGGAAAAAAAGGAAADDSGGGGGGMLLPPGVVIKEEPGLPKRRRRLQPPKRSLGGTLILLPSLQPDEAVLVQELYHEYGTKKIPFFRVIRVVNEAEIEAAERLAALLYTVRLHDIYNEDQRALADAPPAAAAAAFSEPSHVRSARQLLASATDEQLNALGIPRHMHHMAGQLDSPDTYDAFFGHLREVLQQLEAAPAYELVAEMEHDNKKRLRMIDRIERFRRLHEDPLATVPERQAHYEIEEIRLVLCDRKGNTYVVKWAGCPDTSLVNKEGVDLTLPVHKSRSRRLFADFKDERRAIERIERMINDEHTKQSPAQSRPFGLYRVGGKLILTFKSLRDLERLAGHRLVCLKAAPDDDSQPLCDSRDESQDETDEHDERCCWRCKKPVDERAHVVDHPLLSRFIPIATQQGRQQKRRSVQMAWLDGVLADKVVLCKTCFEALKKKGKDMWGGGEVSEYCTICGGTNQPLHPCSDQSCGRFFHTECFRRIFPSVDPCCPYRCHLDRSEINVDAPEGEIPKGAVVELLPLRESRNERRFACLAEPCSVLSPHVKVLYYLSLTAHIGFTEVPISLPSHDIGDKGCKVLSVFARLPHRQTSEDVRVPSASDDMDVDVPSLLSRRGTNPFPPTVSWEILWEVPLSFCRCPSETMCVMKRLEHQLSTGSPHSRPPTHLVCRHFISPFSLETGGPGLMQEEHADRLARARRIRHDGEAEKVADTIDRVPLEIIRATKQAPLDRCPVIERAMGGVGGGGGEGGPVKTASYCCSAGFLTAGIDMEAKERGVQLNVLGVEKDEPCAKAFKYLMSGPPGTNRGFPNGPDCVLASLADVAGVLTTWGEDDSELPSQGRQVAGDVLRHLKEARIVDAGTPCQGFSTARPTAERFRDDRAGEKREVLFQLVEIIRLTKNPYIVLENVKGLPRDHPNALAAVIEDFLSLGYGATIALVNCGMLASRGQWRERLIMMLTRLDHTAPALRLPEAAFTPITLRQHLVDLLKDVLAAEPAGTSAEVPIDLNCLGRERTDIIRGYLTSQSSEADSLQKFLRLVRHLEVGQPSEFDELMSRVEKALRVKLPALAPEMAAATGSKQVQSLDQPLKTVINTDLKLEGTNMKIPPVIKWDSQDALIGARGLSQFKDVKVQQMVSDCVPPAAAQSIARPVFDVLPRPRHHPSDHEQQFVITAGLALAPVPAAAAAAAAAAGPAPFPPPPSAHEPADGNMDVFPLPPPAAAAAAAAAVLPQKRRREEQPDRWSGPDKWDDDSRNVPAWRPSVRHRGDPRGVPQPDGRSRAPVVGMGGVRGESPDDCIVGAAEQSPSPHPHRSHPPPPPAAAAGPSDALVARDPVRRRVVPQQQQSPAPAAAAAAAAPQPREGQGLPSPIYIDLEAEGPPGGQVGKPKKKIRGVQLLGDTLPSKFSSRKEQPK